MYKYTYLLSDSFRNQSTAHRRTTLPSHETKATFNSFCEPMAHNSQHHPKGSSSIHNKVMHESLHKKVAMPHGKENLKKEIVHILDKAKHSNHYDVSKITQSITKGQQQDGIRGRLRRLDDLSDRHDNALKQIDLQSKLKVISSKYNSKKIEAQSNPYQQYKQQKRWMNSTEFNFKKNQQKLKKYDKYQRIPIEHYHQTLNKLTQQQQLSNIQAQNHKKFQQYKTRTLQYKKTSQKLMADDKHMINRKAVKQMINSHLNQAHNAENSFKKYDYKNTIQPRQTIQRAQNQSMSMNNNNNRYYQPMMNLHRNHEHTPTVDNNNQKTIQNLQTLQEKIRSTIQPYLNM